MSSSLTFPNFLTPKKGYQNGKTADGKPVYVDPKTGQNIVGLKDQRAFDNYKKAVGGNTKMPNMNDPNFAGYSMGRDDGDKIVARPSQTLDDMDAQKSAEFDQFFDKPPAGGAQPAPAPTPTQQGAANGRSNVAAVKAAQGGPPPTSAQAEAIRTGKPPVNGVLETNDQGRLAFKKGRQVGRAGFSDKIKNR